MKWCKYLYLPLHKLSEYDNGIQWNYNKYYNSRSIIMENKHGRRMELGNSGMCLHQQIERLLAVVLFCHWTAVQCMHVTYSQQLQRLTKTYSFVQMGEQDGGQHCTCMPRSSCRFHFQQGSFSNYVDIILPFFDYLPMYFDVDIFYSKIGTF